MKKILCFLLALSLILFIGCSSTNCKLQPISKPTPTTQLSHFTDHLISHTVSVIRINKGIAATAVILRLDLNHNFMDVLTNYHVMKSIVAEPQDSVCFGKAIGPTFPPRFTRIPLWCSEIFAPLIWNEEADLAIIRVKLSKKFVLKVRQNKYKLSSIVMGSKVLYGEKLWVVGNHQTFQDVIVERRVALIGLMIKPNQTRPVIQVMLDGSLLPGASGSGVYNQQGQLVGLVSGYYAMLGPIPSPIGVLVVYIRDIQQIIVKYNKFLLATR